METAGLNRIKNWLRELGRSDKAESLAYRLRGARFRFVRAMIGELDPGAPILDVGGTTDYWNTMGHRDPSHPIVLLNKTKESSSCPSITAMTGDARDLSRFADGSFALVHSNSTLQYMTSFDDQRRMASEIRRVGLSYYVQAPSFWFPLETHFLFPAFQWLPERIQIALAMKFALGWYERQTSLTAARALVRSIRLVTRAELSALFPDATIITERYFGWTKSYVALKRHPSARSLDDRKGNKR